MRKDHRQYLRRLRGQGYTTRQNPSTGHLQIYDPAGCLVAVHSGNGGSDWRGLRNLKANINRHRCPAATEAS